MDLRELGALLREERERQGLSVDEVSDKIKITRTCLAAIEEGNESSLPHPVYAKGFIKNYAKLLGLDKGEFLENLSQIYQAEVPPVQEISLARDIPDDACGAPDKFAQRGRLVAVAAGVVGCLVLIGIGWYLYARVFTKPAGQPETVAQQAKPETPAPTPAPVVEPSRPEPPATAPAVPVPPAAPPVATPVAPESAPKPAAPTAPQPQAAPPAAPEARPQAETASRAEPTAEDRATQDIALSGGQATPAPQAPAEAAAPPAKTFTVGERGAHVVTIVAHDRCWLQAGADGGTMHETMLEKGDTFTGRFADYLLVRLGNAGAVEVRFDDKLYPIRSGKGSVKTLKFVARKAGELQAEAAPQPEAVAPAPTPVAPIQPEKLAVPEKPVAAEKPAVVEKPVAPGEPAAGGKELEIFGQDGSWVIVSPDKAPPKEIYVKKGQRITVPFGEKIEVRLGNPSSVVFRYGGQETPVTTEKGETKSIRFP